MRRLLDELLSYPGVPQHWRAADLGAATAPFLAIEFRKNGLTLRFFTTLTCFGTPHDVTLQELRIESFCSTSCRWRFYNDRRLYRARTQRECAACGEAFVPARSDAKYCSVRCRMRSWREINVCNRI